jgi:hypothetical protein
MGGDLSREGEKTVEGGKTCLIRRFRVSELGQSKFFQIFDDKKPKPLTQKLVNAIFFITI